MCSLSSYKAQVLAMLPNLKNLDGERLRTAGGTAFAAATAELAEEAHYGSTAPSPRTSAGAARGGGASRHDELTYSSEKQKLPRVKTRLRLK